MATIKKYSDIDALFGINPITQDIPIRYDSRAISFSIKNIILTMYGERPFNYDFGSSVRLLLFNLAGDQLKIVLRESILNAVTNYEPRVVIQDITIDDSIDLNRVYITITYSIRNTETTVVTDVILERTR